jgi:hypothetical protein
MVSRLTSAQPNAVQNANALPVFENIFENYKNIFMFKN